MSYPMTDKNESIITKEEWQSRLEEFKIKQSDMNRLIMNYLVTGKCALVFGQIDAWRRVLTHTHTRTEGFKEAAEKFRTEAGVEPTVALDTLDNRILIREAVQSGRVQQATHLVNQLHPELLDNDRYLYFHLQQLHLIELIR